MSSTTAVGSDDQGVAEQAASKVQDVASTAQEKADELASKGRNRLSEQLDQRTTEVGSQARSVADVLRRSTKPLQEQGNGTAANVANGAAERIERAGSYLEEKSGDDILMDIEDFARRRPWVVTGLGLLGGIVASRFIKASSEKRYRSSRGFDAAGAYGYGYGGDAGATPAPVTSGGYVGTAGYRSPGDDPLAPER